MSAAIARYRDTLAEIEAQGLFKRERVIASPQSARITLEDGREVLNFCANNYLGLAGHPAVRAAIVRVTTSHLPDEWLSLIHISEPTRPY